MNSLEFLDAVRERHGLTSYNKLAKFLGSSSGHISQYVTGKRKLDPKMCHKVADALGLEVGFVLACIQVERAKRTEDRDAWQRVADLVKVASVASVLALAVYLGVDAPALENAGLGGVCILCYIACAAAWRRFRPARRTDAKPRGPSGRPGRSQSVASGSRSRQSRYALLTSASLLVALSGCASSGSEIAWQTMHLVDVAQTINGPARDACFHERDPLTRGLIGRQPSTEAVIAWGIGAGVAHYALDRWLTNRGHADKKWVQILRALDLGAKGFTIGRNHQIGIRPFGENNCSLR